MTEIPDEENSFHRWVCWIIVLIALATLAGRIAGARSSNGRFPFFCANDRSRWCTISALVDHDSYAIDKVIKRRGWDSIDKVRHKGRDGKWHYYSSKPTLLPTLSAIPYWVMNRLFGVEFEESPFLVVRTTLIFTNLIPFAFYLWLLMRITNEFGETPWGRIFVVAAASWGTFLSAFSVSLNNHVPAAISVLVVVYSILKIWNDDQPPYRYLVLAGLGAAMAAANELPAASLFFSVTVVLLWRFPRQTLIAYVPATILVGAFFFGTNYIAHDSLRPAYAHRDVGDDWYDYPGSYWIGEKQGVDKGEPSTAVYAFNVLIGHYGIFSLTPIFVFSMFGIGYWLIYEQDRLRAFALMTAVLTVVCLVFYTLLRAQKDRNFGGVCSGFRWAFWLIPLWLLALIPIADWLSESRFRRTTAYVFLAASVFSVAFAATNPWQSPWIFQLCQLIWKPEP